MPLYPYLCNNCKKEHTQLHEYKEKPEPCICGSEDLIKQMTLPNRPKIDGMSGMSTRHTTSEYFGPTPDGGTYKMGREEYFPVEVDAKKKESKKKQDAKGATIKVPKKIPKKT